MKKAEMIALLSKIGIPVNEVMSKDETANPRIVYWDSIWQPATSSGNTYFMICTYTIWFFSNIPRDPKLVELSNELNEAGLFPIIYHERTDDGIFQSYFSLEVDEEEL